MTREYTLREFNVLIHQKSGYISQEKRQEFQEKTEEIQETIALHNLCFWEELSQIPNSDELPVGPKAQKLIEKLEWFI